MKKKIFLPVVATMIAVTIFTGGAVMAQENGTSGTGVVQSFASRVAAILGGGVTETQVQSAMDQAQKEMQDEALQSKLDAMKAKLDDMVTQGTLTPEQAAQYKQQADEYYQWLQSRPQGIQGFGGPSMEFGSGGHGHGWGRGHGHSMRGAEDMFEAPDDLAPSQGGSSSGTGTSF